MCELLRFPSDHRRPAEGCGPQHIRDVLAELLDQFPETATPGPKAAQIEIEAANEPLAAACTQGGSRCWCSLEEPVKAW